MVNPLNHNMLLLGTRRNHNVLIRQTQPTTRDDSMGTATSGCNRGHHGRSIIRGKPFWSAKAAAGLPHRPNPTGRRAKRRIRRRSSRSARNPAVDGSHHAAAKRRRVEFGFAWNHFCTVEPLYETISQIFTGLNRAKESEYEMEHVSQRGWFSIVRSMSVASLRRVG